MKSQKIYACVRNMSTQGVDRCGGEEFAWAQTTLLQDAILHGIHAHMCQRALCGRTLHTMCFRVFVCAYILLNSEMWPARATGPIATGAAEVKSLGVDR